MKKYFIVLMALVQSAALYAQAIEGTIKDAETKQPLPYVNVGIIGKGVGTVTDAAGRFKLTLQNNDADSLKLSMIGYRAIAFRAADYATKGGTDKLFMLQPEVIHLKEVKVNPRKLKQSILGNTTQSKSSNAGFSSNKLGNEIGAIIKIKRSPTWIKQFNASLSTPAPDSVILRLNFYSVKDGLPDKILQNQNIFVTVKRGEEKITVNLEPYDITVEDKFFVSLEWIKKSRGRGLMFSASFLRGAIIARETSQAGWEKVGIAGLGFNVLAEY